MNTSLTKALGAAFLLHVGLMTAVQRLLPKTPRASTPAAEQMKTATAVPIAIEFLPTPQALGVRIAVDSSTDAQRSPAPTPSSENPGHRRTPLARSRARPTSNPPNPVDGDPVAAIPGTDTSLMTMRHGASTSSSPFLDTRSGTVPDGPSAAQNRSQTNRPDLLSPGIPVVRDSAPWRPSGGGTMLSKGEPYHAQILSDGTIKFRDRSNVDVNGLTGRFDITDAVMASLGEVLYPYRKLKLMDESREMRANMALSSKAFNLRQALANYKKHLHRIWNQSEMSARERRRALFLLWDECAEIGSPEVLSSARSIRAMTVAFIRKYAPRDSPSGYTAGELEALNRHRRSKPKFSPY